MASTLLQTPNISTGEPAINREVACSQTTVYCYVMGGGADIGTVSNVVNRYNRLTDSVDTVHVLPADVGFSGAYASGAYSHYIIAVGAPNVGSTLHAYIYDENTNLWTDRNINSEIFGQGFGYTGVQVGPYFYLFTIQSSIFNAFRIDLNNPSAGFSNISQTAWTTGYSLQWAKSVYDPITQHVLIFNLNNGILINYNVAQEKAFSVSSTFAPCVPTMGCQPSLTFYDNDFGIVAGKQGDISSTTIGLYQWDWTTQTFSATPVEILSNANFTSQQFGATFQPKAGSVTDPDTGETQTFFGSSMTASVNPGYSANQFWLRTGDPGGVTPTEHNFDTWLTNFLASMGLDSPVGKLIVGSLFVGIMFFILSIKGVPWLLSLGIAGLAVTTMTAASIFDPAVLLGLLAIAMLGGIFLIISALFGRSSGGGE